MQIRLELRPGDLGEIVRLHGVLYAQEYGWDHRFEAYVAQSLSAFALQHDIGRERIWIVDLDDSVAGSVGIVSAGADVAQLRWFLLTPQTRGQGTGKRLIADAIAFAQQAGYRSIFLWTVRGLDAAAHLYQQHGFRLTEEHEASDWGSTVIEQRYELALS